MPILPLDLQALVHSTQTRSILLPLAQPQMLGGTCLGTIVRDTLQRLCLSIGLSPGEVCEQDELSMPKGPSPDFSSKQSTLCGVQ